MSSSNIQSPSEKIRNLVHLIENDFLDGRPFYRQFIYYIRKKYPAVWSDKDDIWQEVFLKLTDENSHSMQDYSGNVDLTIPLNEDVQLSSYIMSRLIFKSIDFFRKKQRYQQTFSEWTYEHDDKSFSLFETIIAHEDGLSKLIDQENLQRAITVFDSLAEHERDILYYRYSENLNYDTIAQKLGILAGTVRSRLYRIKEKFKDKYKEITQ